MDYDDDGILDFISGSYDPGDLYLFRGLGNGEYAAVESILDSAGQPVVHHPVEFAKYEQLKADPDADDDETITARVASFGSWVAPVDWENDGDLDLLIGSFGGQLFRRENIGTRRQPKYDTVSIPVNVNGEPFQVSGHADPVVADWDNDGNWDLIVSTSVGSVAWYRNVGTKDQPEFEAGRTLVAAAADDKSLEQSLAADETPVPGVRAQICVLDYNHDGRLDLIVGDHSSIKRTRELSDKERVELAVIEQEITEIISRISTVRQRMEELRLSKSDSQADLEEIDRQTTSLREKYVEIAAEYASLREDRNRYFDETSMASFIWLYTRR